jgi:mono/diheme cytochrome c family protein
MTPTSSAVTRALVAAVAAISVLSLAVVAWTLFVGHRAVSHFANADDRGAVVQGRRVYLERCASCHGRYLQGQALWQLADQFAHRRAPAHDQTGHTWMHADEDLFFVTKYGRFPDAAATSASSMPAFKDILGDDDILAVIAYIKARWPVGLRVLQAARNPGQAGMPAIAGGANWTFPPDCQAAVQRAGRSSRPPGG